MTTVQITLPDQLAEVARRAGLLSPESLEESLRRQLRTMAASGLFTVLGRLDALDSKDYMPPEEVAQEIAAMRAEKRANRGVR
jgi:hypothetical protein